MLIIAEDIEGEALATLVVNKMRGILNVCAVKASVTAIAVKRFSVTLLFLLVLLQFSKISESELESVKLSDLGSAKKIRITSESTVMVGGAGSKEDIEGRADQIRREIDVTDSEYDREKLQERLAKLAGGVAQINCGATTETEMKERKALLEDAKAATQAALEEGIVPGGGVALIRADKAISSLGLEGDEALGQIIENILDYPLRAIAKNAGLDGAVIVNRVRKLKGKSEGYNADKDKYGDMVEMGIIEPAKVVRTALQNASSVASLLLTTECLVTEIPVEEEDDDHHHDHHDHGMGGGMPGMGGMGGMGGKVVWANARHDGLPLVFYALFNFQNKQ